MITTDILIIGAGPTGLFAVFEAGLLKMKCHLIDALPQIGGQLTELYPKKPIFDIPGFPSINAGELVNNLMEQIKQFQPGFTLGETAQTLTKLEDGTRRFSSVIPAPILLPEMLKLGFKLQESKTFTITSTESFVAVLSIILMFTRFTN